MIVLLMCWSLSQINLFMATEEECFATAVKTLNSAPSTVHNITVLVPHSSTFGLSTNKTWSTLQSLVAGFQNSSEWFNEMFVVICNTCSTKVQQEFWILHRSCTFCAAGVNGNNMTMQSKDSRCARLAAWCVVTLVFTALPGSTGVIWRVKGG